MSSKDCCCEISIVGGFYRERCYWPVWDYYFGSGWRAVRLIRILNPDMTLSFYTSGDNTIRRRLELYAKYERLKPVIVPSQASVSFFYKHPLARPTIETEICERVEVSARGDYIICFGMLEATVQAIGEYVVYDPQSPVHPISFKAQGGRANHLALVMNEAEAKALSGKSEMSQIRNALFEREGCECLVIKRGAKGAVVFSFERDEGSFIPAFKSSNVWPIGSGDIFTTVFSYYWFISHDPGLSAMIASKAVSVYCNSKGALEDVSIEPLLQDTGFMALKPQKKGRVYLAGPFFNLNEKLFIAECRQLLLAMGVAVFSPYHDIGEGDADLVAPKDIEALDSCDCVFAIVDGLDSGTMFEIGYAIAKKIKVVAYVENEPEGALKMLMGTGCDVEKDFTTAIYKACWYASE